MKQRMIKTDIGCLNLIEDEGKLIGLEFAELGSKQCDNSELLTRVENQIQEYMQGKRKSFDVPLYFKGTAFQEEVWNAMREIPFGEVRSYQEIASMIGRPKACRAVGNACNKNPIAIIVPCHRVVAAHQKIGGFGGGLDCKQRLLEIECIKLRGS